jgi:hypothetical protein
MSEIRTNKMKENPAETEWKNISYDGVPQTEAADPVAGSEPVRTEEIKPVKKSHKGRRRVQEVLGGDYLSKNTIVDNVPFMLYLAILIMFYISNTYNTERMYKQIEKTKTELKELRYQYITARSALMFSSKLSELNKRAQALGLKETVIPPSKIFYSGDSVQIGK